MFDTSCLYSVVRNISGATMNFPFLPPHGKELDDDEELSIFGNLLEAVNRGDRFGARNMDSLESALAQGFLEIRQTPAPIVLDLTTDETKMLTVDNGSLVIDDPCFATSLSP